MAFPGENGGIAFESERNGTTNIHFMNADGTGETALTGTLLGAFDPAFSPDRKKVAFSRFRDGATAPSREDRTLRTGWGLGSTMREVPSPKPTCTGFYKVSTGWAAADSPSLLARAAGSMPLAARVRTPAPAATAR